MIYIIFAISKLLFEYSNTIEASKNMRIIVLFSFHIFLSNKELDKEQ